MIELPLDVVVHKNPMTAKYGFGPEGAKCRDCALLCYQQPSNKKYYKCTKRGITNGPATDHRVNWPACRLFKPEEKK